MLLRDHPMMSYQGVCNWPPVWREIDRPETKPLRGEIGILKKVMLSNIQFANRCFLYIDHAGSSYIGCMLFEDKVFCSQMARMLQEHCARPIAEIGDLDLSCTL